MKKAVLIIIIIVAVVGISLAIYFATKKENIAVTDAAVKRRIIDTAKPVEMQAAAVAEIKASAMLQSNDVFAGITGDAGTGRGKG